MALAQGSVVGSVTGLAIIGCGAALVGVVVAMANLWLRWQRSRTRPPEIAPHTVEASSTYRRYLVAAAWAGGSPRNWDHSVRPVLSELVQLAVAERRGGHTPDIRAAVRELLGDRLWPLVDPDAPRSEDRAGPGAGREALLEILDRVENA